MIVSIARSVALLSKSLISNAYPLVYNQRAAVFGGMARGERIAHPDLLASPRHPTPRIPHFARVPLVKAVVGLLTELALCPKPFTFSNLQLVKDAL